MKKPPLPETSRPPRDGDQADADAAPFMLGRHVTAIATRRALAAKEAEPLRLKSR